MKIYWLMLLWVIIFGMICNITAKEVCIVDGIYEKRTSRFWAFITFSIIIFFIGLRSGIADTYTYIKIFNEYPKQLSEMSSYIVDGTQNIGFIYFSVFIKQFISTDYHVWLFIIALISGCCTFITFRKYSSNYGMTVTLFILSCQFTWLLNGIRQFLVVSIMFACTPLIIEKKPAPYILICLILSTIHKSALILIPTYFIVQGAPWNRRTIIFIVIVILGMMFTSTYTNIYEGILEETYQSTSLKEVKSIDDGTSIIRVAVESVPMILAYIYRKQIAEKSTPIINLCINMSIITSGFFIMSSIVKSGILLGRVPIYFSLYNYILLPWIIRNVFEKNERRVLNFLMILLYVIFFIYMMYVAWGGLGYISNILKINY